MIKKNIAIIFTLFLFLSAYSQKKITMEKVNGVYTIPCKVNGIDMRFILDTGASNVTISLTEAKFLIKQNLLTKEDFIDKQKFKVADGNIIEGTIINIKTIEIDGYVLHNIKASIIHNQNAPLLLGQSALKELETFSIDKNILIIENGKTNLKTELDNVFKMLQIEMNSNQFKDSLAQISYSAELWEHNSKGYAITGKRIVKRNNKEVDFEVFVIPLNIIGNTTFDYISNENSKITAITLNYNKPFSLGGEEKKSSTFFLSSNTSGDKFVSIIKRLIKINQKIINQKVDNLYKNEINETFDWIKEKISVWAINEDWIKITYTINLIKQKNGGFAIKGNLKDKFKQDYHTFLIPLDKVRNINFKTMKEGSDSITFMTLSPYDDEMGFMYDSKSTVALPFMLNSNIENHKMKVRFLKAFQNLIKVNDRIIKEKNITEKF